MSDHWNSALKVDVFGKEKAPNLEPCKASTELEAFEGVLREAFEAFEALGVARLAWKQLTRQYNG